MLPARKTLALCALALTIIFLSGCPASNPAISVSANSHEFTPAGANWTLEVWNSGEDGSRLYFDVAAQQDWITCSPSSASSSGPGDRRRIAISVDYDKIPAPTFTGTVMVTAAQGTEPVRVTALKDILDVSNASYDFELSDTPWFFQVWNAHPEMLPDAAFTVTANADWLSFQPTEAASTGKDDKKTIMAVVNRSGLDSGNYVATVTMAGPYIAPRTVTVSMTSDEDSSATGGWRVSDVKALHAPPYLVEYAFALRDEDYHAVIAEPAQFSGVTCKEDGVPISTETSWHLAKGTSKQLMTALILDYTLSMADTRVHGDSDGDHITDAIENMEYAAKNVFLDALSADAQVALYEFHRAEEDPRQVADFTADKEYLKDSIDRIWSEYVQGFPAASRCWDALYMAAESFDTDNSADDQQTIVFLSDGYDESSVRSYQDVITIANDRGISVYCIGFGTEVNSTLLQLITEKTRGAFYPANEASELADRFEQIITDLGGQYVLRWATTKMHEFVPSFSLTYSAADLDHTMQYEALAYYDPDDYRGDTLQGVLRVVPSGNETNTTALLRASYVPRYITQINLSVTSQYPFTVSLADVGSYGLCATWSLEEDVDADTGARLIYLEAPDHGEMLAGIPFASFGPVLEFEFADVVEDVATLFDDISTDNSTYTGGQSFVIE